MSKRPAPPEPDEPIPVVAHAKRHGGVLRIDMPMVPETSMAERADVVLRALAISEGRGPCEGDEDGHCRFPICLTDGCQGRPT